MGLVDIAGKTTVALCCVIIGHVLVPSHSWIASLAFILVAFRLWAQSDPDKVFIASIVLAVLCGAFAVALHGSVLQVSKNKTRGNDPPRPMDVPSTKPRSHEPDLPEDPILGGSARVQVIRPQIELQTETFHLCEGDGATAELTFILRADPGEEQVLKRLLMVFF